MSHHLRVPTLLLLISVPPVAVAADAHLGVHPGRGEMVLLRDVSARQAYRPAPPGIALIVDPTPNRELAQSLGTGELSDEDFAALSSGQQLGSVHAAGGAPAQLTGQALTGTLGRATGDGGALSGTGPGRSIGVPMGAVGGATRGIGDRITGALARFPLGDAGRDAGDRSMKRLLPALLLACAPAGPALADEYAQMLGYLAQTSIDGRALAGARGAIAANQAAGDLNQQANLRSLALGPHTLGAISSAQRRSDDHYDVPVQAQARIGGQALSGAAGIASINQASGSANAELNAVALHLADQGMRGAMDGVPSAAATPAERQTAAIPAGRTASRNVAVEATALRGFEGVLQLNQIAGSANATGNQLLLSVSPGP